MEKRKNRIHYNLGDRIFIASTYVIVSLVVLITLYPFLYLISVSISNHQAVLNGEVMLFPKGPFDLKSYEVFFADSGIWRAYWNSILYSVVAAVFGLFVNSCAAYALSQPIFRWRKQFTLFFMVPMFVGGGMIPTYVLISSLGMIDTMWPLVLPGALSTWYLLIFRTFFNNDIPDSLRESAILDGANEFQVYIRIVLPLSKAIFATVAMYYLVGQWNSYFSPMLYLNSQELYPLQIILQRKLAVNYGQKLDAAMMYNEYSAIPAEAMRCAAILASALPIMCIYPFIQKYFVKGVMIGAVKG